MDCLHFIKSHHESLKGALNVLVDTDGIKLRRALIDELTRDLTVYLALEKDYLYPEIATLFPGAEAAAAMGVANGTALTRRAKALKALVGKTAAEQEEAYPKRLRELYDATMKHFEQEEQVLMPKMRAMIRTEDREDLGQVFLEVKSEILAAQNSESASARSRKRA